MRRYNPVPSSFDVVATGGPSFRNLTLTQVVEDPNMRDSEHSLFIQAADLAAYLLYQNVQPCGYMKKKGGQNYFHRLGPALCRAASSKDPDGVVRL